MNRPELTIFHRVVALTLLTRGGFADAADLAEQFDASTDHVHQAIAVLQAERMVDIDHTAAPGQSLELTENGWGWCVAEVAADPPPDLAELDDPDQIAYGRTLYAILGSLHRYLKSADLALADFITIANSSRL